MSDSRKAPPGSVVQCPLIDGAFIDEGDCYDFQAAAQGARGPDYRQGMLQKYAVKFKGHPMDLMRKCLRHQITLASVGEYPDNYLAELQAALEELG